MPGRATYATLRMWSSGLLSCQTMRFWIPLAIVEPGHISGSLKGNVIPTTVKELNAVKNHLVAETFGRIQKAFLVEALMSAGGSITRAAERVGMKRANFSALMKKHHISAKPQTP